MKKLLSNNTMNNKCKILCVMNLWQLYKFPMMTMVTMNQNNSTLAKKIITRKVQFKKVLQLKIIVNLLIQALYHKIILLAIHLWNNLDININKILITLHLPSSPLEVRCMILNRTLLRTALIIIYTYIAHLSSQRIWLVVNHNKINKQL